MALISIFIFYYLKIRKEYFNNSGPNCQPGVYCPPNKGQLQTTQTTQEPGLGPNLRDVKLCYNLNEEECTQVSVCDWNSEFKLCEEHKCYDYDDETCKQNNNCVLMNSQSTCNPKDNKCYNYPVEKCPSDKCKIDNTNGYNECVDKIPECYTFGDNTKCNSNKDRCIWVKDIGGVGGYCEAIKDKCYLYKTPDLCSQEPEYCNWETNSDVMGMENNYCEVNYFG